MEIKNRYNAGYMELILETLKEKGVIDEILPLPNDGFLSIYSMPGSSITVSNVGNNMYEYKFETMTEGE